jgi:hypothetical protein
MVLFLFKTGNVSDTGFYHRLLVEPTQLGPIDRASPYLRTPVKVYKLSIAQTIYESYDKH